MNGNRDKVRMIIDFDGEVDDSVIRDVARALTRRITVQIRVNGHDVSFDQFLALCQERVEANSE